MKTPYSKISGGLAIAAAALTLAFGATAANAATVTLSKYNADPATLTLSGISSGGYAAVQFQVAYSSKFHGAAIFAGGPYYCAQNNVNNGTGYCESGSGIPLNTLISYTDQQVSAGTIDNTSNLVNMPVYMFSGTNDTTVKTAVMDTLQQYYQHYGVKTINYNKTSTAAHAWISDDGPNSCNSSYSPYINKCSDTPDPEKTFLTMFYGTLNAKNTGTLGGSYVQFNQNEFCPGGSCSGIDMDSSGWAYVPANCANGQTCKVHLAIHGCVQYQGIIQQQFVQKSGLNEWADTNNIIVVYPQLIAQGDNTKSGYNPNGCWDFWGYNGSDYALRSGKQMVAVMAMINRITGNYTGGGGGGGGGGALATTNPSSITVNTGGTASFSVSASGGTSPYKYQWYRNGSAISGATSASYSFTAQSADNGAQFKATVTDSATTPATVTSGTATLTVSSGTCYTATNYAHTTASPARAHMVISTGHAAANGSNQDMGLDNTLVTTKLRQTGTGYYVIDNTCN